MPFPALAVAVSRRKVWQLEQTRLSRLLRDIKNAAATDTYGMYFPIHIHGSTLFPRACYLDECWFPVIHVVTGDGQITRYQCRNSYPAEAIAVAFARIEMKMLARVLKEACGQLDPR